MNMTIGTFVTRKLCDDKLHKTALAGALLLVGAAYPSLAEDTENRFAKQLAPVAPAPAGEWWKASWREGWTYQHRGDFSLSARVRVRFQHGKSDVSFWESLKNKVNEVGAEYAGELNLETRGNSLAESGVLQNQNSEILLSRYYPRTDVTRAIFRKPVGEPTKLDTILNLITDDTDRTSIIKNFMSGLFATGTTLVVPDPSLTVTTVSAFAGRWTGEKADDFASSQLKKHGIQKRADGGIEINPESSLLKRFESTTTLADLANLAMQFNEAFTRRMFLIRASEKSGDELDTRQIFNEGKDLVTFIDMKENEGGKHAIDWLKSRMANYTQPQDLVRGVFQRETFALSSQIFDSMKREPGDTWIVPAGFFNSFLHPDLQGTFRGDVVMHYVGDVKVPDRHDKNVVFEAREIEILFKGKVEGRTYQSTMEYVEPRFSAKLREDTDAVLFIDKNDGYVRQADLNMISDVQAGLPEMPILKGFDVAGDARFEVHYTCVGTPPEKP